MQALELSPPSSSPAIQELVDLANRFLDAAKAPATRKAYAADLRDYSEFCTMNGLSPFGPGGEVLSLYIAQLAGRGKKPSTIARRVAALATEYHARGFRETPAASFLVSEVLRGVKRTLGVAPEDRKDPLLLDDLQRIVAACPEKLIGIRDRALCLLGFALGSRRASLASIAVSDLALMSGEGMVVTIRRDKEDQEQLGRKVPVAFGAQPETCPIRWTAAWLDAANIVDMDGPLFRAVDRHGNVSTRPLDPGSIARILKKAARRSGMSEEKVAKLGGHSLRAGAATVAAINGANEREIAAITGHHSREVQRYIRDANLFRASAAGKLGL